uniref:FHA domain-containing protein n=1 Tax=Heterorhabditis bacteriophora TaxID=37862 RepID=A0A1I7X9G1_HETBA
MCFTCDLELYNEDSSSSEDDTSESDYDSRILDTKAIKGREIGVYPLGSKSVEQTKEKKDENSILRSKYWKQLKESENDYRKFNFDPRKTYEDKNLLWDSQVEEKKLEKELLDYFEDEPKEFRKLKIPKRKNADLEYYDEYLPENKMTYRVINPQIQQKYEEVVPQPALADDLLGLRKDVHLAIDPPKDSSVADIHASIEFHSFTRTFWLRDHSLAGNTTVNGVLVDGQDGAKNYHKHCVDKDDCGKKVILPVLGSGSNYPVLESRCLCIDLFCRISNFVCIAVPVTMKILKVIFIDLRVQQEDSQSTPQHETGSEGSPRQIAVQYRLPKRANSVGNNLLQRVVRLQAEVARKDQELGELRSREYQLRSMSRAHAPNEAYQRGPLGSEYQNLPYDDFLPRMTLPVLSGSEQNSSTYIESNGLQTGNGGNLLEWCHVTSKYKKQAASTGNRQLD